MPEVDVIDGEPDAQLDNAEVVAGQAVDGKDLVNELAVAGDDAGLQTVEYPLVGPFHSQRKKSTVTLLFFE